MTGPERLPEVHFRVRFALPDRKELNNGTKKRSGIAIWDRITLSIRNFCNKVVGDVEESFCDLIVERQDLFTS